MGKLEGFVEENLASGGVQKVGTAHDLVDVHEGVIDNDGELIGEDAIGATNNEIAYCLLNVLLDGTGQHVGKGDDAVVIDAEAEGGTTVVGFVLPALLLGQVAARSGVTRTFVAVRGAGDAGDFGTAAIAWIDKTGVEQALKVEVVGVLTLALNIGRVRTANVRAFVPVEAKPVEVLKHTFSGAGANAWAVEVFDAQDKLTADDAGEKPGKQGGAQVAKVQITGGTGRIATAN